MEHEYVLPVQDETRAELADISAANAAVLCGKLVQLASGCIYSDDGNIIGLHER